MTQRSTYLALLITAPLAFACSDPASEATSNGGSGVTSSSNASTAGSVTTSSTVSSASTSASTTSGATNTTGGMTTNGTTGAGPTTGSTTTDGAPTSGTATGTMTGSVGSTGGSGGSTSTDGGTTGVGGSGATGGFGGDVFVEDSGDDCEIGAVPEANTANSKLPDPFLKFDGTRMSTKAEWRCHRREIRSVMERYVYGEKPPKPETVTGTITDTQITVNVSQGGNSASFSAAVDLPSTGSPPYPVIIGYNSFGSISLDETLIKDEGVAIIRYNPYDAGAEGTGRQNKQGAFYTIHGATHAKTGLLIAWAWGVSRLIDVIEADGDQLLKMTGVGVTGCSRFGKGSFVAGAFDERIALGIPFESGTAGVPILRGIGKLEQSQSLSSAYGEQPWFGDDFQPFASNPNNLPLDTHGTVAMYAPRGLLILDNPHIANLGPKAAHVAALAGAEVFSALGVPGNIAYHSDTSNGTHCSVRSEYAEPLRQAIRKYLLGTGNEPGEIVANSTAMGNLNDWKDWETPTLD